MVIHSSLLFSQSYCLRLQETYTVCISIRLHNVQDNSFLFPRPHPLKFILTPAFSAPCTAGGHIYPSRRDVGASSSYFTLRTVARYSDSYEENLDLSGKTPSVYNPNELNEEPKRHLELYRSRVVFKIAISFSIFLLNIFEDVINE